MDETRRSEAVSRAKAVAVVAAVEHIMLSYNWDHQPTIKRINASLQSRGYTVWIDVEKMQGSTVEAMADAVEGASMFLYAISKAYKESTNCRMEAQYAFQQQKDMVPLMMEENYKPKGWVSPSTKSCAFGCAIPLS